MKHRLLLALLLLPLVVQADALSARGLGEALVLLVSVVLAFLTAVLFLVSLQWPRWRGLLVLQGLLLALLSWGSIVFADGYAPSTPLLVLVVLTLLLLGRTLARRAPTKPDSWVSFLSAMAGGVLWVGLLLLYAASHYAR